LVLNDSWLLRPSAVANWRPSTARAAAAGLAIRDHTTPEVGYLLGMLLVLLGNMWYHIGELLIPLLIPLPAINNYSVFGPSPILLAAILDILRHVSDRISSCHFGSEIKTKKCYFRLLHFILNEVAKLGILRLTSPS